MAVAVVTGASTGIGLETAKGLAENNFDLILVSRSSHKLISIKNDLESQYRIKCDVFSYDLSLIESNIKFHEEVVKKFQQVDVLINNAGIGVRASLEELNIDDFLKVFNVNVFGLSLFTKEIIPLMKAKKSGTIINIGSTASLKGYKNGSIYSSSKFAVRCLTQCWQAELRPFNIRVCQVNPSEVTTAFANPERVERDEVHNKLTPKEISHAIISAIEMDDRGFINELNVWATNPFN